MTNEKEYLNFKDTLIETLKSRRVSNSNPIDEADRIEKFIKDSHYLDDISNAISRAGTKKQIFIDAVKFLNLLSSYYHIKSVTSGKRVIEGKEVKSIKQNKNHKITYTDEGIIIKEIRPENELKSDINTTKKFLETMKKHGLHSENAKVAYNYCSQLLSNLETKDIKDIPYYKHKNLQASKQDIKDFFKSLRKEIKVLKSDDVKQFIESI